MGCCSLQCFSQVDLGDIKRQEAISNLHESTRASVNKLIAGWSVFKHDTEAGRLLSRLYGVDPSGRPQIKYPKLRQRNTKIKHIQVNSVQAKNEKKPLVQAPRVGRKSMKTNNHKALNAIPRRKSAAACRNDVQKTSMAMKSYRPPHMNAFASDDEKIRLNHIFSSKGGRALPDELTHLNNESANKKDQLHKKREQCSVEVEEDGPPRSMMAKQIILEIEERKQFQLDLEIKGVVKSALGDQIAEEIESRVRELSKHDAEVAKAYMMKAFKSQM